MIRITIIKTRKVAHFHYNLNIYVDGVLKKSIIHVEEYQLKRLADEICPSTHFDLTKSSVENGNNMVMMYKSNYGTLVHYHFF
jgi:hypothetical protein